MSGWLERRRLAKEEARQRAVAADLAANDLITALGPPKPRPVPGQDAAPPPKPAPATPAPAASPPPAEAWARPEPDHEVAAPEPAVPDSDPQAPAPSAAPQAEPAPAPASTGPLSPDAAVAELLRVAGAQSAAVIELGSGMAVATAGDAGVDPELAAATAVEVLRSHRDLLGADAVEDAMIATAQRYLLLNATAGTGDEVAVQLVLDRGRANLALARRRLAQVAGALTL